MAYPRVELLAADWIERPAYRGAHIVLDISGEEWARDEPPDGEVSEREAAALLGVSLITIHRWLGRGVLAWGFSPWGQPAIPLEEVRREYVKQSGRRS